MEGDNRGRSILSRSRNAKPKTSHQREDSLQSSRSSRAVQFGLYNGRLVDVSEVERGVACGCVCPGCFTPLVARQGRVNVWHFAHDQLGGSVEGCTASSESYLHSVAKHALRDRIESAIVAGETLPMTWRCLRCPRRHDRDLVSRAASVGLERRSLGSFVPDLTLYAQDDHIWVVIEIVVTHPPDPAKLDYAGDQNVTVVEFTISDFDDIRRLRNRTIVLRPSRVYGNCPQPPVDVFVAVSSARWAAKWTGGGTLGGECTGGSAVSAYKDGTAAVLEKLPSNSEVTIYSASSQLVSFLGQPFDSWTANERRWQLDSTDKHRLFAAVHRHLSVKGVKVSVSDPQIVDCKHLLKTNNPER